MALGSCNEVNVLLNFIKDLNYINQNEYNQLINQYSILGKMIYKLKVKWK